MERTRRHPGERTADAADARLPVLDGGGALLRKAFPDHWSFLLGELALYSLLVLLLTGVWLTFFFHPGMREVVYAGSYVPLRGVRVSEAFDSTLHISFDIRGGLLMRQTHHWAALVLVAWILRIALVLAPVAAFLVTRRLCHALTDAEQQRLVHGVASGEVRQSVEGGYESDHHPVTDFRPGAPRAPLTPADPSPGPRTGTRSPRRPGPAPRGR